MDFRECGLIAFKELWANKVRSFLSVLGIIIGMIAFLLMAAIMAGIEKTWTDYVEAEGVLEKGSLVSQDPVLNGKNRPDLKRALTFDDEELIRRHPLVRVASAEAMRYAPISYGRNKAYESVIGGSVPIIDLHKHALARGRLFTQDDGDRSRNVCVIGDNIREVLFGNEDPLGKTITISENVFEVVGVLKKKQILDRGKNIIEYKNKTVFIPIRVFMIKLGPNANIDQVHFLVKDRRQLAAAKREIGRVVDESRRRAGDTKVVTQEEQFLKSKKSFESMRISFSLIAAVSLIVGGVGIMNIMIASIAQRVKEIGIRKSVGARIRDIMIQFLMESVVIGISGGILGIVLFFGISAAIMAFVKDMSLVIRPEALGLAIIFSLAVGALSGIYPALKASRLDPIQALRYQ